MKYLKIYLVTTFFVAIALFSKAQNIITIHYIDQIDSIGKNAPGYPDTGKYILDRDLDFKNPTHYSNGIIDSVNHISGNGWNPINFLGTFDGNNHSISNYFIYRPSYYFDINGSSYPDFYDNSIFGTGFFRYNAGTIKNLQLLKYKLSGFIEFINGGYIRLISVGGAFVGCNAGTIDNCYADGTVIFNSADNYVGGFVGKNNGLITNCGAKTSITLAAFANGASAAPFGGFLLLNLGANKIKNCFSSVNLLGNYVLSGDRLYLGWYEPGAFVWSDYQTGGDSILNCYTTNTVLNFAGSTNYNTHKKALYQDSNRTKYVNCYTPSNYISEVFNISNSKLVATFNSITNVTESYTAANFGTAAGAYQFNNTFLPVLKNLEKTRILPFQVDTLKNLYFKDLNGNLTKQANFLYDFRVDKSNRILPPNNFIFDSITINNTLITTDSFYGFQLKNIYPTDTIILKLNVFKNISKIEQLDSIGKFNNYPLNINYLLLNDLDFTNPLNYSAGVVNTQFTSGTGFNPIPNYTGLFNGNGFSIKNLKINKNTDTVGLFKKIDKGARLYKLKITNAQVIGNNVVGILAGLVHKDALITDCYVSGVDSGINNVGGLVGLNNGAIINTISKVAVKGASNIGGFVGVNYNGSINNSFNNGSVTASVNGGLFAGVNEGANIENCYAWGTISQNVNIGAFIYENKNGASVRKCYTVVKNSPFIVNNSAISINNKVGATLKTTGGELGNSNAFFFQSNYYLPYLYKINTTQLIDSQYTTLEELKLFKDSVYFEYLNYNTDTALQIIYFNAKTLTTTNIKGTPYPLTYKLYTSYPWLNVDINNGSLTINNNAPIGEYNIRVSINSMFDTFYRNIHLFVNPNPIVDFRYSKDTVTVIQSAGNSGLPTITNTNLQIKYKLISNVPNSIQIDSNTGIVSWTNKLVSGIYRLTLQAADSFTSLNKIFILNILPYPNSIYQLNNVYTSTQNGLGANGDYITLPTLNIDSVYTVETWFNLNANTGTDNPFIFSFGGWTNGLIFNTANRSLVVKSWNNEVSVGYNLTAGRWVHLAVVVNGRNTKVYANGNIVFNNELLNPTINNQWLNNRIGNAQAVGNLSTTLGSFKEFRIWKVARPIDSVIKYKDTFVNENDTNLYYYLPLTSSIANTIANETILNNNAISANTNTGVSTIHSIAAQYTLDTSNRNNIQNIYGTYTDTLLSNEILQYNIDNGLTWVDISANNNKFNFNLNYFKGGIILLRSNLGNRSFNYINIVYAPTNFYYAKNRIDTVNNQSGETAIPIINKGGSLNLKFRLINNLNTNISVDSITGAIKWSALTNVGIYTIKVRAINELGYVDTSIILNIYRPIFNEAKLFSNNSFQTTNIGFGGPGTGGDYISLPTINLTNVNYTIETWFKYNENTISGYKRIFDFGQSATVASSNILLCFRDGSTVASPTIFFFAGDGQQADFAIPASINIQNWNHYALVLNGTTASFYINGILMGTYTGQKSTANYSSNFIGRSNDSTATTVGNWQDFRIWSKARTPQEIKNYFKTRLVKYEDSLVYNLSLNGKYTSSIDYLVNGAKLPNDAMSKEAIIDSSIVTSADNNGARFVFDSTNQKLYGTISNVLSSGDSIQISYNNGINWVSVDTVVQNTWVASLPSQFLFGTIQIRTKLVNRNFSNFIVKIKPSYFNYTPNFYANLEGVADSTNAPTIRASTPLNYILKTTKNGYSINSTTGRIKWNNTVLTAKDTLLVTAKNEVDSISTQVYVNIGDSITDFSYSIDTLKIPFTTKDSSTLPIITGSGVKTYSIIGGDTAGIRINASTGKIYVADTMQVGTYNLTIQVQNVYNSKTTNVIIKILPNIPIIGYADTFFSIYFNDVGTSNKAIVNKTGVANTFKIISENNAHIIINSNTGEIMNESKLYNGIYNLQVEMSNEAGADTTNFTIIVKSYVDTIHGFYNSVFSKSSNAMARTGDYIELPRLDLKNTPYTIETWFKYNGAGPISSYIRIFDFNIDNPPSGAANSNILVCFNNGSSILNPTILVFAGNGQYNINVPANNHVNISNWNHYALVYNASGTTASLYINGVLVSANIPAAASTQDFLSSYIGVASDNSFSTIGSYKEFKIWKRALSTQEINDEYQTITNTFKNKLYYYLPVEKFNKTNQYILNNTPIINASTAIGANPNNATIKSIGDTSAKYLIETNNNIVFGNIKDSLNDNEFIQININNEPDWYNATVKNNNWFYNIQTNLEINQINVRGYDSLNGIISRTFNSLFLDDKIRNLNYSENPKIINYKENAHSVQPTYISSSTVKFKLINNPYPNSIRIDSNFGIINFLNTLPTGMHILSVEASSLYDTATINYIVTVLGLKPSGLSYPNKIITYYANLVNAQPTLNEAGGLNVKYTMLNAPTGFIIDSNTGVITATNDIQVGDYKIQINVSNEIGYDSNFLNIEFRSFNDTILGLLANTTQLTTNATNQNGDKIILPNLNLDSSYTVETWFNLDSNTGTNYPFIYALGNWNNGLIFNDQSGNNRSLNLKSWGVEANSGANPPTGIIIQPNVWNHYTVVVNGRNSKVYINGQLRREYTALGVPTNNNLFLNNKLGTGEGANLNLSTTLGKYKEFKIWNKAISAEEISTNFTNQHIILDTNLVYFLPLSNSLANQKIPNNTNLIGANPLNAQNFQNSTIISVNNTGARYTIDTFNRKLYGTIKNPLAIDEILQYSLDEQNWEDITGWEGMVWTVNLPNFFKVGIIRVRSIINNNVTNRVFNTIPYYIASDTPTNMQVLVDNSNNNINIHFTPPLFKGGLDTISYYNIKLKQGNNVTNFTTKDTNYVIKNLLDNTNYQVQISVTNIVASSDTTTPINVKTYPSPTITTYSSNGGFIEISKMVKYGVNYRVTYQPFTGYKVDSLFINNVYTPVADTSTGFILQNVIANHTIQVVFAKRVYTIQTIINENGEISNAANVYYGDSVVVTYTPNIGYKVDSIFIDGIYNPTLSASNINTYIFKDINNSHTFKVIFSIIKFRIYANISSGGVINKNILANYGSNYQVTYSVKPGYTFDSLFVNDIYIPDSVNSYTFTNILGDSSIFIKLKLIIYTISLNIVNGGTVTPNTDTTITVIDTITYNFINENNLYIDSVIVNGINQLNRKFYTFKNTISNQILKVVFKLKPANTSNIAANVLTDGGTITPSGNIFIPNDSSQQFSITNNPGYVLDKIWVNNSSVDSTNSYTFYNVTGDSTIEVFFKIDTFIITTYYNNGGAINPAGTNTITYFDSLVYSISPDLGYYVDSLFIDENIIPNATEYTFKNVLKNTSIRGVFKQKTFTIVASTNEGGSISPIGIDTVIYGSNKPYQITADEGYYLDSLIVDEINVEKTGQYNFLNVIANHSIRAVFKKRKYTIRAIAFANGQISPAGDTAIFYNDAITYTITPNIGYNIEKILLDGVPININTNTVTLRNINAGHTIQVSFIIKKFTINITKGLNGRTTPSVSSIQVNYGADTNILIIPNNGYTIDTLKIDNIITPEKYVISFTKVNANHTVYVSFKIAQIIKTYTILASSNSGGIISPVGTSIINSGESISYTITPNSGYILDSLIVDNIQVTNALTYTFSNVTANHTIKGVFKIDCANYTKRTPVIVRTSNNLSSDLTFASYTWYRDGVLQSTITNNVYTPSVAGVYTLMGTENTACLSNLSKKYYYASTCITPTGRVGNGAYIQGNIIGENNQIIVKWCTEILQENIIIRVIDLNGVLLNEQIIPANLGTYIIYKQSIKSKQFIIQVLDNKGDLLQLSDIIN